MPDQESGLPQQLVLTEQQAVVAGICTAICGAFLIDDIPSAMKQLNVLRRQLRTPEGLAAFNQLSNGCMKIGQGAGWSVRDDGMVTADLRPRRKEKNG